MCVEKNHIRIATDARLVEIGAVAALYEAVGFGSTDEYRCSSLSMARLFGPGVFGVFAFEDERLVGLARVLSDRVMCSWLAELCVHPDWQQRGIGSRLLDEVVAQFGHTALYAEPFLPQQDLFKRHGILPHSRLIACGRAPNQ